MYTPLVPLRFGTQVTNVTYIMMMKNLKFA
jgi:hypothetical protein